MLKHVMVKHLSWLRGDVGTGCDIRRSRAIGLVPAWLSLALVMAFTLSAAGELAPESQEPISPIAPVEVPDTAKLALGEALFGDVRLSRSRTVACVSCHQLDRGGDDGRARSVAADGQLLAFNAPTVFNVAYNFRLNWRGNFRTLEEQNEAVLLDPTLMNIDWNELLARLREDRDYAQWFASAYGSPPDRENVLDALAVFQRSLVTAGARFDRYLAGEAGALTADERRGYALFKDYGCVACHQGANVGGNLFQKFGVFADPFADEQEVDSADLGRFALTGLETDRHVFRVPSLRNVALTAPYFHDGRTASLTEAVEIMAGSQLGRELPDKDVSSIVDFLDALTGELGGRSLEQQESGARP